MSDITGMQKGVIKRLTRLVIKNIAGNVIYCTVKNPYVYIIVENVTGWPK